jgi:putative toxin-antitoxin system antitoxin component (TIGR02293 family)
LDREIGYTAVMARAVLKEVSSYPGIKQADVTSPGVALAESADAQISKIREGIPAKVFVDTAKRLGLSQKELAEKLGLAPRTIAARVASAGGKLNAEESEKILRVQEVLDQAVRVFESEQAGREWLMSPAFGLKGQRPIDFLDIEPGSKLVRDYLGAIEYGNYW